VSLELVRALVKVVELFAEGFLGEYPCAKCGGTTKREEGEPRPRFCDKCGAEFPSTSPTYAVAKETPAALPQDRSCPICKRKYGANSTYCKWDGTKLVEKTTP